MVEEEFVNELKNALLNDGDNQFYNVYQPQIKLINDKYMLTGLEALIRWNNPQFGLVAPTQFIEQIRAINLIEVCDEISYKNAFKHQKKFEKYGLTLSINTDLSNYSNSGFSNKIIEAINDTRIDSGLVNIELLELGKIDSYETALRIMNTLKNNKIKFSLDDWVSHHPLNKYIPSGSEQLPFDRIKLDKTIVEEICSNGENSYIFKSNIKEFPKTEVLAEGVETMDQLNILREIGINSFQGYLFSEPKSYNEILQFLDNNTLEFIPTQTNINTRNNLTLSNKSNLKAIDATPLNYAF